MPQGCWELGSSKGHVLCMTNELAAWNLQMDEAAKECLVLTMQMLAGLQDELAERRPLHLHAAGRADAVGLSVWFCGVRVDTKGVDGFLQTGVEPVHRCAQFSAFRIACTIPQAPLRSSSALHHWCPWASTDPQCPRKSVHKG